MNNTEKISFIFQTGRKARMHIENEVFKDGGAKLPLLCELSSVQMKVAMQIHQTGPLSLSDLAGRLGLSNPSASVIVEKLVDKQVVVRERDPHDRRRVCLRIHEKVQSQMQALQDRFQQAFAEIASKVGDENIERWFQVALKIEQILDEEGAQK